MVDAARLRQVLLNLAGNGVKFTEAGGVTLTARTEPGAADGHARVVFSVADTGPGIAAGDAEHIFDEFEQGDSASTRRHGGAGLGLAISRHIVRHMGSDIELTARPGGGALFRFALELPVRAGPEKPAIRLSGRRLLILSPPGAEPPAIATALQRAEADARWVSSPHEAAALVGAATAAELPYDAILVDSRSAPDVVAGLAHIREAAGGAIPAVVLIEPGERGRIESLARRRLQRLSRAPGPPVLVAARRQRDRHASRASS